MRRLVLRQRYFTGICSIAVVTPASFQRSVMGLKKRGKQIKRQMRRLELRQRYFTDICSIAVVTSALFQRSVMDLKKRGKQIETKQHNSTTVNGVPGFLSNHPNWLPRPLTHKRVLPPLWYRSIGEKAW